jgi:hypothetical protein
MHSVRFILLVGALVCFAVPAIRALFSNSFDFTNTGLALLTASFLFG